MSESTLYSTLHHQDSYSSTSYAYPSTQATDVEPFIMSTQDPLTQMTMTVETSTMERDAKRLRMTPPSYEESDDSSHTNFQQQSAIQHLNQDQETGEGQTSRARAMNNESDETVGSSREQQEQEEQEGHANTEEQTQQQDLDHNMNDGAEQEQQLEEQEQEELLHNSTAIRAKERLNDIRSKLSQVQDEFIQGMNTVVQSFMNKLSENMYERSVKCRSIMLEVEELFERNNQSRHQLNQTKEMTYSLFSSVAEKHSSNNNNTTNSDNNE